MTVHPEWLLLIDASLTHRIAKELRDRGRNALAARDLRVDRFLDPALLRFIHMAWPLATLVTGDDHMPEEHGHLVARWSLTLAIVDPVVPGSHTKETWKREVVHRWAHKMQEQERGTVYRYAAASGGRRWTRPKNPRL